MPYSFTFDLSKLSQALFKDIAEFSEKGEVPKKIGEIARNLVKRFNVDKITGLAIADSITVIEDIININLKNSYYRESFLKTSKNAYAIDLPLGLSGAFFSSKRVFFSPNVL